MQIFPTIYVTLTIWVVYPSFLVSNFHYTGIILKIRKTC